MDIKSITSDTSINDNKDIVVDEITNELNTDEEIYRIFQCDFINSNYSDTEVGSLDTVSMDSFYSSEYYSLSNKTSTDKVSQQRNTNSVRDNISDRSSDHDYDDDDNNKKTMCLIILRIFLKRCFCIDDE